MHLPISSLLSARPRSFFICLAVSGLFFSSAQAQNAASGSTEVSAADFQADVTSRADATKAIKDGKQDPIAALVGLSTAAKLASAPTAKSEARYGWAAIDVGMRLIYSDNAASALKVFAEAERILGQAAQDFSATEKKDRASALYSLGIVRWKYLRKPAEAMDAFVSALQDDPDNAVIQTAKKQLDAQWGPVIASRKTTG